MATDGHPPWDARYAALGRTQARYLWILLALSVFFLALDAQALASQWPIALGRSRFAHDPDVVTIPFLQLPISSGVVRMFGPLILVVLLRATLGTLAAAKTALSRIGPDDGDSSIEAYDHHPNVIDMAVYLSDTAKPKRLAYSLAAVSYPLYLSLHAAVAAYLSYSVVVNTSCPDATRLILVWSTQVLALGFAIPTCVGLFGFWRGRLLKVSHYWRKASAAQREGQR
ncbi:MAG: hypothetical protein LAO51_12830 [Acidobacteriia bacterium]|nr:hypothetical protein [Terriglobia bacterium]